MINESKFKRALDLVKKKNNRKEEDYKENGLDLEKNDLLAMIIAALIVIIPVVLFVFALIIGAVWFFYYR